MLKLETKADLDALYTGNIKESSSLEYKASLAIDKRDDTKKLEMARDVSALANADGGQIVYGMTELDHGPAGLDNGIDGRAYPEIWFEQVLQQHVTPPIQGLRIHHVPLADLMVAVVITIPATKSDPHQVSDGRYYRRHNHNRLIMEHYEVRDFFRRAVAPDLIVDFRFDRLATTRVLQYNRNEEQTPTGITPLVSNASSQPALYSVITLFVDGRLTFAGPLSSKYDRSFETEKEGRKVRFFQATFNATREMPIFYEQPTQLPNIGVVVPESLLYTREPFIITYEARAPGCFNTGRYAVHVDNGRELRLVREA
jgi:hypothetical protein